ncbi:MAG: hypothetical protein ACXWWY_10860 [Candidatus Deferrimicrobiaceae bacterium]
MAQRSWVAATALCLAVVTAVTGPFPRDVSAGILALSCTSGRIPARESGSVTMRATEDASPFLHGAVSARYPTWVILLLVILLLLLWLIYLTWTGWKPLISGG